MDGKIPFLRGSDETCESATKLQYFMYFKQNIVSCFKKVSNKKSSRKIIIIYILNPERINPLMKQQDDRLVM